MESFRYRIALADGTILSEEARAPDAPSLRAGLEEKGLLVLDIQSGTRGLAAFFQRLKNRPGRGVPARTLLTFTQELLELLRSGLPLVEALGLLAGQNEHPVLRSALRDIRGEIISGSSFSEALGRRPALFSKLYASSVRSGEQSGHLIDILSRYITFRSAMLGLRDRLTTSLSYPAFLFMVSVFLILFMVSFVLPTFSAMYGDFNAPLPAGTRFLLTTSEIIREWYALFIGIGVALSLGIRRTYKSARGRRLIDGVLIRLPLFGPMIRRYNTAILTRTLAAVLSGGIPLLAGLEMVRESLANRALSERLGRVIEKVRAGEPLSKALHDADLLSRVVDRMVGVGEASGSLERMLDHAAAFQEQEITTRLNRMTGLLEPVLMLVLGGIIGLVVIMIYLPIFSIVEVVR